MAAETPPAAVRSIQAERLTVAPDVLVDAIAVVAAFMILASTVIVAVRITLTEREIAAVLAFVVKRDTCPCREAVASLPLVAIMGTPVMARSSDAATPLLAILVMEAARVSALATAALAAVRRSCPCRVSVLAPAHVAERTTRAALVMVPEPALAAVLAAATALASMPVVLARAERGSIP